MQECSHTKAAFTISTLYYQRAGNSIIEYQEIMTHLTTGSAVMARTNVITYRIILTFMFKTQFDINSAVMIRKFKLCIIVI